MKGYYREGGDQLSPSTLRTGREEMGLGFNREDFDGIEELPSRAALDRWPGREGGSVLGEGQLGLWRPVRSIG